MSTSPPSVNAQVTDTVSQTTMGVVGEAPAVAVGTLYQTAAHANGVLMENASANQHNLNQLNPAIVAQAIAKING